MERNTLETVLGAVVLLVAGYFLYLVYSQTDVSAEAGGYPLELRFDSGGSTGIGTDVRIAGVKVGTVTDQYFDPSAYQAVVTIELDDDVKLPKDTSAVVTSDGLLGDNYILLNIGGDTEMLAPNDRIRNVQGAINLADLINKFVVGTPGGASN
ncbi:MAG: outer membrane lipid asymmetry maintenance protein MlaD [Rhodospirillales bacterium]|nr:outer membrane lipid asymmetry maintenance protein MlaD [Rhodospirillales bacterium]